MYTRRLYRKLAVEIMPGELKNLALAISSKCNHPRDKDARRRSGEKKIRGPKEEPSSGAKRLTKLLSKSVGAVSSSITHSSRSAAAAAPPVDVGVKMAPVASPESDGSSLLNGESCANDQHLSIYFTPSNLVETSETPKVSTRVRLKSESAVKPWSTRNGSIANGQDEEFSFDESSEHWRSLTHCDASKGNETDDDTVMSVITGQIPSTSSKPDVGERKSWYATRKPYRSVAYKTWTVGAARKLLNSRSDYDLPPATSKTGSVAKSAKILREESASDGEEKFYNCSYSRSHDDELNRMYLDVISNIQADRSTKPNMATSLTSAADFNRMRARKCASSDAVTFFSALGNESLLSPVNSVSTGSDKNLSTSSHHGDKKPENGKPELKIDSDLLPDFLEMRETPILDNDDYHITANTIPNPISPGSGRSWLLMASSSTDDVWNCEESSKMGLEPQRQAPRSESKPNFGSRSTGDCFSSEDYFKFTLKKRLLQQCQTRDSGSREDDWPTRRKDVAAPLLALDKEIRVALRNFDDFNNNSGSTRQRASRSSSPTALASLLSAAQQRWRQQAERFTRRMDRASCRVKMENHGRLESVELPMSNGPQLLPQISKSVRVPPQLSSSSFSSSSSSSSSMSWISQGTSSKQNPKKANEFSNGGMEWTPNDPCNASVNGQRHCEAPMLRNRSQTTSANSPFRSSDEAMRFLKQELANIRRKDHQILKQLKMLDAEINRRKSETDALATIRSSESEVLELDNGEYIMSGPTGPLLDVNTKPILSTAHCFENFNLSNGATAALDANSNSLHADVPPLPKCLINFKTL